MIKIHIKPKTAIISPILPFKLSDLITVEAKEAKLSVIDSNFKEVERWIDVRRNYRTV